MSVEPKIVQIRAKSTKLWARRFSYSFLDGIALKSTPLIIHCCISLVGPDLKISQAIQRFPEASISFKFKKDKEIYLINEDKPNQICRCREGVQIQRITWTPHTSHVVR
eukprot:TRINITY_DN4851_c0_g1_i13.p1 TRINITY_DN4851_c0_g1~~TRINITY_DN4851_c0_g1_i13.p1  ORF type:complete len:109 (+),score=5.43 TRINITY_DN4851_c0_g1_i13:669-995(+)